MALPFPRAFSGPTVAAAGAALLLLALVIRTTADSDLWGHLRFGLDAVETGRLVSDDPYSFTQDRPWINHEWLSEVQMALAYKAGGVPGLALLKGFLVFTALGLIWNTLRRVELGTRIVVFGFVALATAPITGTLRPQVWTMLALVVLCRILMADQTRHRRWLPLLYAAWANVHGGWIVGLGVLVVWTTVELVRARRLLVEPTLVAVASVAATLATPYGPNLWTFMLTTVRMGRDITEWQPIWNSRPVFALCWVAAVAMSAWLLRQPAPTRWPTAAVLAMLAYSSARVVRIEALLVIAAAILLAPQLAAWRPRRARQIDPSPAEPFVGALLFAVTASLALWVTSTSLRCMSVETPRAADPAAARVLMQAPAGRLVTFFDWGQYAIWHLGPTLRVSMDGRRETVYSNARLEEHGAILNGQPEGLAVLEAWRAEYVWLPASSEPTRQWLLDHGYRLEYSSDRSFVAVRADLAPLPPPSSADPAWACFPG